MRNFDEFIEKTAGIQKIRRQLKAVNKEIDKTKQDPSSMSDTLKHLRDNRKNLAIKYNAKMADGGARAEASNIGGRASDNSRLQRIALKLRDAENEKFNTKIPSANTYSTAPERLKRQEKIKELVSKNKLKKSVEQAEAMGVQSDKILKNKTDIDNYFLGGGSKASSPKASASSLALPAPVKNTTKTTSTTSKINPKHVALGATAVAAVPAIMYGAKVLKNRKKQREEEKQYK